MTVTEFIDKLNYIEQKTRNIYMYAAPGMPVTTATISAKSKQNLNHWYTPAKIAKLKSVANKTPTYWGFDCVNLIKAVLWGWDEDPTKTYGGAVYGSNGVPDTNANGFIKKCLNVSTDFTNIEPGEAVWMSGHIGVYVGDDYVIECTPRWDGNVQRTILKNRPNSKTGNGRKWVKHGKIPWVEYDTAPAPAEPTKFCLKKGNRGIYVELLQLMLMIKGYSLPKYGADGEWGTETDNAVAKAKTDHGLKSSGTALSKDEYLKLCELEV